MKAHWHVATGFAGYGPDGADGYATADDVIGAADLARDDLREEIGGLSDTAESYADMKDFESAWKSHKLADELDIVRANISPKRAEAPLYRDQPGAWREMLTQLIGQTFPLALDIDGSRRLYVWECETPDCDQTDDDDDA